MLTPEEKKIICDFFDLFFCKTREMSLSQQKESTVKDAPESKKRMIPLTKWTEFHNWPTTSALRCLVFDADKNGFNHCIRRVGRRVIIDEDAFFEWVDSKETSKH